MRTHHLIMTSLAFVLFGITSLASTQPARSGEFGKKRTMKNRRRRFFSIVETLVVGLAFFVATPQAGATDETQSALSLDEPKIYWTSFFGPAVWRSSPDGSNVETLVTAVGGNGIAVDTENEKIYWTGGVFVLDIERSDLDGMNIEVVVPDGITRNPRGIALDVDAGKMYWTDEFDPIRRADLDGSNIEDLLDPGASPTGIALDVASGKMYWRENFGRKIRRANLDGSEAEDVLDADVERG